jgi:hypothetical protein
MPNYCSNTLWVEGNPEQLKEFKTKTTKQADHDQPNGYEFTLEILYPTPTELMDESAFGNSENSEALTEKYGYSDWYTWRVNKWGTKWDVCESDIYEDSDKDFMAIFDSAWAPPINWLEHVAPQFPELKFKLAFSEPGMGFCGCATWDIESGYNLEESQLEWQTEDSKQVEYDSEKERWKIIETDEIIDDEDFYPIEFNPYID